MSATRVIQQVKITEVTKQDAVYESTSIKYAIPSDDDAPDHVYGPIKIGPPSVDVSKNLNIIGRDICEVNGLPGSPVITVNRVDWRRPKDKPVEVRMGGTIAAGVEFLTPWRNRDRLPEQTLGAINSLAVSAFEMVEADTDYQLKLVFEADEEAEVAG